MHDREKYYKDKNALPCKYFSQSHTMETGGDGMPIKVPLDMHALGKRLKLARVARDLTIQQLSALSGVGINQISRLENGDKPGVRVDTLAALAVPLEVSLDHLVGLSDATAASTTTRTRAAAPETKPAAKRPRTRKAASVG
jgi:transcriptional regulator with XRE-family HTH domain